MEYTFRVRPSAEHVAMAEPPPVTCRHEFWAKVWDWQPSEQAASSQIFCVKVAPLGAGGGFALDDDAEPGAGVGDGGDGGLGPLPDTCDEHGNDVIRHWSVPFSTRM